MKRYISIVSILWMTFSLASCVQIFEDDYSETINFVNSGVKAVTKGYVVTDDNFQTIFPGDSKFTISAYPVNGQQQAQGFPDANYKITNDRFTSGTEHTWGTEDMNFWIYPNGQKFISNYTQTASGLSFKYTYSRSESDKDAQNSEDALFAFTNAKPNRDVNVTFQHALASIKVHYKTVKIAHHVSKISISGLKTTGTCKFRPSATLANGEFDWTLEGGEGTYSQSFDDLYITTPNVDMTEGVMTFFVLPGNTEFTVDVALDPIGGRMSHAQQLFSLPDNPLKAGECVHIYIDDDMTITKRDDAPTNKVIDSIPGSPTTYSITIDAFVTGKQTVTVKEKNVDFVLVLDNSRSMGNTMGGITRLQALKNAVNAFADVISEHSKQAVNGHKVAIVTFNSSAEVVHDFISLKESDNLALFKSIINNISTGSGTMPSLGLDEALNLYNNSTLARRVDTETEMKADKVCIFFTDGEPRGNWNAGSTGGKTEAGNAVAKAKTLKDSGVQMYSIGVFDKNDSRIVEFLDRVSSNYPDATTFDFGSRNSYTMRYTIDGTNYDIKLPWTGSLYIREFDGYHYEDASGYYNKSSDYSNLYYSPDQNDYYKVTTKGKNKDFTIKFGGARADIKIGNNTRYLDHVYRRTESYVYNATEVREWTSSSDFSECYYYAKGGYHKVSRQSVSEYCDFVNGTRLSDENAIYSTKVETTAGLSAIFEGIAQRTALTEAFVSLGKQAYAYDMLSDIFKLPAGYGATGNGDIKLYSVEQVGYDTSLGPKIEDRIVWANERVDITNLTDSHGEKLYKIEFTEGNKSIKVDGWDYSANCCGDGCQHEDMFGNKGHKLVIEINNLELKPGFDGEHYTNECGSGIYDEDGNLVIPFNSPSVVIGSSTTTAP